MALIAERGGSSVNGCDDWSTSMGSAMLDLVDDEVVSIKCGWRKIFGEGCRLSRDGSLAVGLKKIDSLLQSGTFTDG